MTRAAPAKPQNVALDPGVRVADRYVVRRIIGQGGMGQVVEVEHESLGRRFALKVLRLERWNDELVRRFNREARALAKLTTPRVAQVTDFGIDAMCGPFYVMELLEGETLEDTLERDVKLSPRKALSVAAELCDALADVHAEGIVHRDLKPSNVGLPSKGPVGVKLLDFGLAASMDEAFLSKITQSQQILGSLPYMAPEQFNGADPAASMDLYAVGIVLYETLTGRLPFMAPSTAALIHQILATPVPPLPPELAGLPMVQSLLEQLLAKVPTQRFSSAKAASQAIRDVLGKLGGAHPQTRALQGEMPPTMEARAVADAKGVGHAPTLMVAESGTRLTGDVMPSVSEPSHAGMLAAGVVPPTPLAGTPIHGYQAASHASSVGPAHGHPPPRPTLPEASTPGYAPGQELVSVSTAQIAPPTNPWPMRIVLVAALGMVFAGLTALVVALGLMFLDDADTRATPAVSAPTEPVAAPVPEVAADPSVGPQPMEANAPQETEETAPEPPGETPEPISPREVEEQAPVPSQETQRRGRGAAPPEPPPPPQVRPLAPQTGRRLSGQNNGVIREW